MIARFHAKAIRDLPHGELKAVSSRNENKAKTVGQEFGVDWYADYRKLLDRKAVEIILAIYQSNREGRPVVLPLKSQISII